MLRNLGRGLGMFLEGGKTHTTSIVSCGGWDLVGLARGCLFRLSGFIGLFGMLVRLGCMDG
jgi:hypothetical protein